MSNALNAGYHMQTITVNWQAAADGSVADETTPNVTGYLVRAVAIPGSDAEQPTDAYDVTVKDSDGCDLMGGKFGNLANDSVQQAVPVDKDFAASPMWCQGQLTVSVANNAVNGATGTIKLYIAVPR